jgi:hypothetical protein
MKTRQGFVSNSSSSSFLIVSAGDEDILTDGIWDGDWEEAVNGSDTVSMDIDEFISKLQEAQEKGATKVVFEHGEMSDY